MKSATQYEITKPEFGIGFVSTQLSPAALAHEVSMAWKVAATQVFAATCSQDVLTYWREQLVPDDFPIDPNTGESLQANVVQWLRATVLAPSETPVSSFDTPSDKGCTVDENGKWKRTRHFALTKIGDPWSADEILQLYVQQTNLSIPAEVAAELAAMPITGFLSWVVGPTS